MDGARWGELKRIFAAALASADSERASLLARECGTDHELREEVEALLMQQQRAGRFLEDAPDASMPGRIGEFRVLGVLGRGGMGVVYLAEQEHPRRTVALKVIEPLALSPRTVRRFEHEAELLARLQHPGIAQIHAAGTAELFGTRTPYFAMERIDGRPLLDDARVRGLDVRAKVELMTLVCDAVQHAHQRGVIHRDLKPGNILVDASGAPKILDFGVARATELDLCITTFASGHGELAGTLPYMSPEQVEGDPSRIDTRSDIYALGVVLYELLTGRLPYPVEGVSLPEAARVIREVEPTPPSNVVRMLRGDMETIVLKALAKEPDRRYASASALGADLTHWLRDEPLSARPPSSLYHLAKFARRNRVLVAGVTATILALVLGFAGTMTKAIEANEQRDAALDAQRDLESEVERVGAIKGFLTDLLLSVDQHYQGPDARLVDVLEAAAAEIDGDFPEQPEIRGELHYVLGVAFKMLSRTTEARTHLEASLRLRSEVLGPEDPATLESTSALAQTLQEMGELELAAQMCEQLAAARERVLGADHDDTLNTVYDLALMRLQQSRFAAARELFERVIAAREGRFGKTDAGVIAATSGLASVLSQLGDLAGAESRLREAIDAMRANGEAEANVLALCNNLGDVLRKQGKLDEAEQVHRTTWEARRRLLSDDHASTLASSGNLAVTLLERGKLDEAQVQFTDLLARMEQTLPPTHLGRLSALNNFATLLDKRGEHGEAVRLHREVLEQRRAQLGDDNEKTLSSMKNLGVGLFKIGELEESEQWLQRAVDGCRRVFGDPHQRTTEALDALDRVRRARAAR